MKTKYARQIRDGIVTANLAGKLLDMEKYFVALQFVSGQMEGATDLTLRAYERTLDNRGK
jgi:hypothetical protein